MDLGWIELIFFYGLALGLIAWQYISTSRSLEKDRAERRESEAREAAEKEAAENGGSATPSPEASDKAA